MDLPDNKEVSLEEHFSKALEWYGKKYLSPTAHRSYAICASIFLLLLSTAILIQVAKLFPVVEVRRYIVQLDKASTGKRLSILSRRGQGKFYMRFFAKCLIESYIKKREYYDFASIQNQVKFVQVKSSSDVLNDYLKQFQVENPSSFVSKYRDQATRQPYSVVVEVNSDDSAKATFNTIVYNYDGNLIENMQWEVGILFNIHSNFLDNTQEMKDFSFLVKEYKLTPGKNMMLYESKSS